jgi:hypothetical protein
LPFRGSDRTEDGSMTGEKSSRNALCAQGICRRDLLKAAAACLLVGCSPAQQRVISSTHTPMPTDIPLPTDTPAPTPTSVPAPTATARPTRKPVSHYVAYCGFNCTRCSSYSGACEGCLAKEGAQLQRYPTTCGIRACARERELVNCAHCDEYPCARLERHFARSLMSKAALEEVRESLK